MEELKDLFKEFPTAKVLIDHLGFWKPPNM
jgi:hypothetical protein